MSTTDSTRPPPDLITVLRRASQELIDGHDIRDRDALTTQLVAAAVIMVGPAIGGGISRTTERDVRSSHATSRAVYDLDQLQDELGEGPCIDAAERPPEDGVIEARDLVGDAATRRWPSFAPRAVADGFRSMLSVSLTGQERGRRSALNFYAATADAFSTEDRTVAGLFATHAGALLYGADQAAHLSLALSSRDVIGQAKGILMERFGLDADQAFAMLVQSSQDTNMKLVDVARWLTGDRRELRPPGGDSDDG